MKAEDILFADWVENFLGWILIGCFVFILLVVVILVIAAFTVGLGPSECVVVNGLEYCR